MNRKPGLLKGHPRIDFLANHRENLVFGSFDLSVEGSTYNAQNLSMCYVKDLSYSFRLRKGVQCRRQHRPNSSGSRFLIVFHGEEHRDQGRNGPVQETSR